MNRDLEALISGASAVHKRFFPGRVNFCVAGKGFPAFSLTGSSCALSCKHCGRRLIMNLPPADTPRLLKKACYEAHRHGAKGVLLTGGCTADAKVPVNPFLETIAEIKRETGLIMLAHTGITSREEALAVKESGLDGVCIDVVGSPEVSEEIYGVRITLGMYRRTLKAYESAGMKGIYPHVCVGLLNGRLSHEKAALDIISCIRPGSIVLTGLTGFDGTPMEDVRISPEDFIRVLCHARRKFPDTYISLGCARGKGEIRSEIDKMALSAGVNAIAVPTASAYEEARRLGLDIREYSACCALPSELLI